MVQICLPLSNFYRIKYDKKIAKRTNFEEQESTFLKQSSKLANKDNLSEEWGKKPEAESGCIWYNLISGNILSYEKFFCSHEFSFS